MSEEVVDSSADAGTGERPVFLTVLCILTFIGSGLTGLQSLIELINFHFIWFALNSVLSVAASALCLYGAIQMWGLNKSGFTDYVAGAAISVLASIIALAYPNSSIVTMAITIVINVAFVLMYKANLIACSIDKGSIISKIVNAIKNVASNFSTDSAAKIDDSNKQVNSQIKKAGIMFIICFGLLIISAILTLLGQEGVIKMTRSSELKTFADVLKIISILSYVTGLMGGVFLLQQKGKNQ